MIPMIAMTLELQRGVKPPATNSRSVGGVWRAAATIAGARTMGGIHDVDRYWVDRLADSPPSPA